MQVSFKPKYIETHQKLLLHSKKKKETYILQLCWESPKTNTCCISLGHTINFADCCGRNAEPSAHSSHCTVR